MATKKENDPKIRERQRKYKAEYYLKNRDRLREKQMEYHRTIVRKYDPEGYQKNRERRLQLSREYYQKNRAVILERRKKKEVS